MTGRAPGGGRAGLAGPAGAHGCCPRRARSGARRPHLHDSTESRPRPTQYHPTAPPPTESVELRRASPASPALGAQRGRPVLPTGLDRAVQVASAAQLHGIWAPTRRRQPRNAATHRIRGVTPGKSGEPGPRGTAGPSGTADRARPGGVACTTPRIAPPEPPRTTAEPHNPPNPWSYAGATKRTAPGSTASSTG